MTTAAERREVRIKAAEAGVHVAVDAYRAEPTPAGHRTVAARVQDLIRLSGGVMRQPTPWRFGFWGAP